MLRLKIAQGIALTGIAVFVIGMVIIMLGSKFSWFDSETQVHSVFVLMTSAQAIGYCAFLFGGLLTALKMAWNAAKWGWFLIPFFPIDLVIGLTVFVIVIQLMLIFPIIPIRTAYKQSL